MSAETVAESIPPGYKQTEVGVIPEDWEIATLGEVVTKFVHGGTPSTKHEDYWKGDIPWITGADILDQRVSEIRRFITTDAVKNSSTNIVNKGNLLLVSRTGVGKLAIALCDIAISQDFTGICTKSEKLSTKYLFRFLDMNQSILKNQNQGTSILGITRETLSSLIILFPPTLVEQEAIATALSDTDALIKSLEQLIAKKRQIKQGAMQELLTGKRRLPGFSGEWEVKEIHEISDVDIESLTTTTQPNYEFKYISLEEVDCGALKGWTEHIFATAPSRARRKIRKGDVLISTVRPNLQSHCLINEDWNDFVCSTGFSVLRCKSELANPYYVFAHFFSSFIERQIEALISGSNYPAINSSDVKKLKIPLPPSVEEQAAIATILSDMDAEITALEEKLVKTRQIKQGMMQELLTGRIRLV